MGAITTTGEAIFAFMARAVLVTLVAALVSALPAIVIMTSDMDAELRLGYALNLMLLALAGCTAIGLPISLAAYRMIRENAVFGLGNVILLANALGSVIVLILTIVAGPFGAVFFGIPAVIAANAFAIAGWIIIIKPLRETIKEAQ